VLTRLRVRGFKNLFDVDVRFGPFTCVAGANGVGKSNLFDAIRFLHLLTRYPLMEAVQKIRDTSGQSLDPAALFTTFGKFRAPEMRFTADLIIERQAQDDFGVTAEAGISSLRYEVAFAHEREDGVSRLKLVHESLDPIPVGEARKNLGFNAGREFQQTAIDGRRTRPFISTETKEGGPTEITVHQEGHGGRKLPATHSTRTVIGGLASSEFPTILAAHREMESWKTLLLEPSAMRAPSFYGDPRFIDSRGANLPATVYRLLKLDEKEDRGGRTLAALANQLSRLLEDVRRVRLVSDERTESWTLELCGRDGVFHPARSLSDGTLRFLVLAVLGLDPEARGIICLEEPENGIHPDRIQAMVDLLKEFAVDPAFPVGPDNPLRQVIVNTHSPRVVSHINKDELIYLTDQGLQQEGAQGRVTGIRVPPGGWRAKLSEGSTRLAPGNLVAYLGSAADGWLTMDRRVCNSPGSGQSEWQGTSGSSSSQASGGPERSEGNLTRLVDSCF
jgi:predicted ATPase